MNATDKRLANLRRRVNRARKFPNNTCPASRHLHQWADALLAGRAPEGCEAMTLGLSILEVLESLWKLRTASPEYQAEVNASLCRIAERQRERGSSPPMSTPTLKG